MSKSAVQDFDPVRHELIFFIIILLLVIRKLTKGRETSLDDAIMMNRIEGLRNQMNESVFNLFTGKFSI